jgi:hypothetical protein
LTACFLALLLDNSFVRAQGAYKNIVTCLAGDGIEGGHLSFIDPTGRTKVISPILDRKICRSLKRAARFRAISLYFLLLLLDLRYLAIKIRYTRSRLLRNFISCFAQMIENVHNLKFQHTKIETPREIIVPKNLDFTDPGRRPYLSFR